MRESNALSRNRIIGELTRSEHGDLKKYCDVGNEAVKREPEFFAHLIAWDACKGQIRDTKVALPIISLAGEEFPKELVDNSLAHLAMLRPREFLKAYRFGLDLKMKSRVKKTLNSLTTLYLHDLESVQGRWDSTAVQHRRTLKELYALAHVKPSARAQRVLFKKNYPPDSVFEKIAKLKDMRPIEAAGTILEFKIPFLVAIGALGSKIKDTDLALALIERMSPTELVTTVKAFEKLGINTVPVLRAAYDEAISRAAKSKKATLKTSKAADQVQDEGLRAKIVALQEKQIQALGGVDGNWLVLGDKSGSMSDAIETARQVSATLAKMVTGSVSLVFFDTAPNFIDVTGKTYDQIQKLTRFIRAYGGTSIGCGLLAAMDRKIDIDGIVVVSDAAENSTPFLVDQYKRFTANYGKEVPVYLYRVGTNTLAWYADQDLAKSFRTAGLDLQEFDLRGGVDFYSLPNLVATMRTNRYSLSDEILATPLLTLKDVINEDYNVSSTT